VGTPQHLAIELFQSVTGTKMTHVPYRGAGPAMEGLMAGDIQVMFPTLTTVDSYIKAGSIKVLANTDAERSPVYPNLPTVAESGYPAYHANLWYALLAPAKTPPVVIERINASLKKIIDDPETKTKLEALGFQPTASTPDQLKQTIVSDINTWAPIIDRLNLKVSN
jgi:tripartite-type tricarboxylate transporter receptor subunit TctC